MFGNSLTLTCVEASLRVHEAIEIITVNVQAPTALKELQALAPDSVIIDLGTVPADFPFLLLREQPGVLVIGVDAAEDGLLVLSVQQARAVTTRDLVQVIETWAGPARPNGQGIERIGVALGPSLR